VGEKNGAASPSWKKQNPKEGGNDGGLKHKALIGQEERKPKKKSPEIPKSSSKKETKKKRREE